MAGLFSIRTSSIRWVESKDPRARRTLGSAHRGSKSSTRSIGFAPPVRGIYLHQ